MAGKARVIVASTWAFDQHAVEDMTTQFEPSTANVKVDCAYHTSDDVFVLQGNNLEKSLSKFGSRMMDYIEDQRNKDLLDIPRVHRLQVSEAITGAEDDIADASSEIDTQETLLDLDSDGEDAPHNRCTKNWLALAGGLGSFANAPQYFLKEIGALTGTNLTVENQGIGIQVSGKDPEDVEDALGRLTRLDNSLSLRSRPQIGHMLQVPGKSNLQYRIDTYECRDGTASRHILSDPNVPLSTPLKQMSVTMALSYDEGKQKFVAVHHSKQLQPPKALAAPRVWFNYKFHEIGDGKKYLQLPTTVEKRGTAPASDAADEASSGSNDNLSSEVTAREHPHLAFEKVKQVDRWVNHTMKNDSDSIPVHQSESHASSPQETPASEPRRVPGIKKRRVAVMPRSQPVVPVPVPVADTPVIPVVDFDKNKTDSLIKAMKPEPSLQVSGPDEIFTSIKNESNHMADDETVGEANRVNSFLGLEKLEPDAACKSTKNIEKEEVHIAATAPVGLLLDLSSPSIDITSKHLSSLDFDQPALTPDSPQTGIHGQVQKENRLGELHFTLPKVESTVLKDQVETPCTKNVATLKEMLRNLPSEPMCIAQEIEVSGETSIYQTMEQQSPKESNPDGIESKVQRQLTLDDVWGLHTKSVKCSSETSDKLTVELDMASPLELPAQVSTIEPSKKQNANLETISSDQPAGTSPTETLVPTHIAEDEVIMDPDSVPKSLSLDERASIICKTDASPTEMHVPEQNAATDIPKDLNTQSDIILTQEPLMEPETRAIEFPLPLQIPTADVSEGHGKEQKPLSETTTVKMVKVGKRQVDNEETSEKIRELFTVIKPVLETARSFPGALTFEMQIGLILIPRMPRAYKGEEFQLEGWNKIFQSANNVAAPGAKFLRKLTTSGADVDFILGLKASKSNGEGRLFEEDITDYGVVYEYHCRSKDGQIIVIIIDEAGNVRVRGSDSVLGAVNVHYPLKAWDGSAILRGAMEHRRGIDINLDKAIDTIVNSVWVQPDRSLIRIFCQIPHEDSLKIEKVMMRRWTRHRYIRPEEAGPDKDVAEAKMATVQQAKDRGDGTVCVDRVSEPDDHHLGIFLKITEVQDLLTAAHSADTSVLRARCTPGEDMVMKGRLWYEAAIVSSSIEEILHSNINLELGEETNDWCSEDLLGNDAGLVGGIHDADSVAAAIGHTGIGEMYRVNRMVIEKIDGVGSWDFDSDLFEDFAAPNSVPGVVEQPEEPRAPIPEPSTMLVQLPNPKDQQFSELESIQGFDSASVLALQKATKMQKKFKAGFW